MGVLSDLIREGDELVERTNQSADQRKEITLVASETMMLGARSLNALYALRALSDFHVDDQAAVIARSLSEAAVDIEYLNQTTTRRLRDGTEIVLGPDEKSELFATHKQIAFFSIVTAALEIGPDDPLPEEMAREFPEGHWDNCRRLRNEALELRGRLGLGRRPHPYWACAGNGEMIGELSRAFPDQAGRLRQYRRMFQDFSFFAHANPNDTPYVLKPSGRLRTVYRDDSIIGAAVIAGVEAFRWWGHAFGEDHRGRLLTYVRRIREPENGEE